ncbi:MAG: filamentous hemagglutinin N-terminal domain-containing protein, partial [Cyanobacteriota bacterium SKYGB_h_bin112]|nr:filamentous hemagglutinin N-terminal domain-containing protein [Cyanobacteriota bacterium SKYGB_h_bin112]
MHRENCLPAIAQHLPVQRCNSCSQILPLLVALGSLLIAPPTQAQLIPDNTLGSEASTVTPNAPVRGLPADLIQGGATRGTNLYHSFQDFNVADQQRVYFANPTSIDSILTRVTGNNLSHILGTLGVDGAASLFLLNPHGILFGANVKLDIAGSFTASTADSFLLPDGSQFSATNPQAPPLLTVAVTPGLQAGDTNPEAWLTNPSSPHFLFPGSEKGTSASLSPSPSLGEGDTGGEGLIPVSQELLSS